MPGLFDELALRGVTLRNRIGMSPMVQVSSTEGFVSDWHLVHLGSRAVGGAGLIMTEATAVTPTGRVSINDLGIWSDDHVAGLRRVADFIHGEGAIAGIQLAHAGRKSSYAPNFDGNGMQPLRHLTAAQGAWPVMGASPLPFGADSPVPREMNRRDIGEVRNAFRLAAARAVEAGFRWLELHAAHGYLPHCFYSPLSNRRTDDYGGSFGNRVRFVREVVGDLRDAWPDDRVLAVRLSYTDWVDGGWTLDETVELARLLRADGADLIDVSSGGSTPTTVALMRELTEEGQAAVSAALARGEPFAEIPIGPGYQLPGARAVREGADIPVAAVGMICDPSQADRIVRDGSADMVMLGRELLRNPYWPQHAAIELGCTPGVRTPVQYYLAWKDRGRFGHLPVSAPTLEKDLGGGN